MDSWGGRRGSDGGVEATLRDNKVGKGRRGPSRRVDRKAEQLICMETSGRRREDGRPKFTADS